MQEAPSEPQAALLLPSWQAPVESQQPLQLATVQRALPGVQEGASAPKSPSASPSASAGITGVVFMRVLESAGRPPARERCAFYPTFAPKVQIHPMNQRSKG